MTHRHAIVPFKFALSGYSKVKFQKGKIFPLLLLSVLLGFSSRQILPQRICLDEKEDETPFALRLQLLVLLSPELHERFRSLSRCDMRQQRTAEYRGIRSGF